MWPDRKCPFFLGVVIFFLCLLSLLIDKRKGHYFHCIKRIGIVFLPKLKMSVDYEL